MRHASHIFHLAGYPAQSLLEFLSSQLAYADCRFFLLFDFSSSHYFGVRMILPGSQIDRARKMVRGKHKDVVAR
jgi:hypothetical protein